MLTQQLHHGGCGEDDVRLKKALILSLNASCLAETHKNSSLSQTIPSKAYSLSLVMGSLYSLVRETRTQRSFLGQWMFG